jgi:hypothetical protein
MWDAIQFILLLTGYILVAYLIIKFISKFIIARINSYLRLLTLSFLYALFWGIGIAGSGGDPGFAFPVPNIVAIALMISIGFYRGVVTTGLYIFLFWWAIIFLFMLIKHFIKKESRFKQADSNLDKTLLATLGFMQVGLTNISSAICKSQLQFGQTNIYQL